MISPTHMPYRDDVAALTARCATLEREIEHRTNELAETREALEAAIGRNRTLPTPIDGVLSVTEIIVVIACIGAAIGALYGLDLIGNRSKGGPHYTAASTVDKLANHHLSWDVQTEHGPSWCPSDLRELAAAVGETESATIDPWDRPYRVVCDPDRKLPNGAFFGVYSIGEDGVDGTADDITSWRQTRLQ